MNLKDVRNLDKDDVLELLGLQTKQSTGAWLTGALTTFGVGLLVGAGVGLLLAPKPGRELRDDIKDKFRRQAEEASNAVGLSGSGSRGDQPGASKAY